MIGSILSALGSVPGLAGLAAVLVLLPLIWLYSPLLGAGDFFPFEGVLPRIGLMAVPLLIYFAAVIVSARRRHRRDAALVQEAAAPDPASTATAEEEAALREKLTGALQQLKQATGGKGAFLYELPWYVFIGPPGSGKTTAIAQSGLEFPLADGGRWPASAAPGTASGG